MLHKESIVFTQIHCTYYSLAASPTPSPTGQPKDSGKPGGTRNNPSVGENLALILGSIFGALVLFIGALIVAAVVIYCCCCKSKEKNGKKRVTEPKERSSSDIGSTNSDKASDENEKETRPKPSAKEPPVAPGASKDTKKQGESRL